MHASRRLTAILASLASISLSCAVAPGAVRPPLPPDASAAVASAQPDSLGGEIAAAERFFSLRRTGLHPPELARLARAVVAEANRAGLPPALVLAMIEIESGGHNFAASPVGALGLMQLRPATAEALAARIGVPWRGAVTLFDPVANVRLGVSYLEELIQRFGGIATALAAYNWGPTRIGERLRRNEPVPALYARNVMAAWRRSSSAI